MKKAKDQVKDKSLFASITLPNGKEVKSTVLRLLENKKTGGIASGLAILFQDNRTGFP